MTAAIIGAPSRWRMRLLPARVCRQANLCAGHFLQRVCGGVDVVGHGRSVGVGLDAVVDGVAAQSAGAEARQALVELLVLDLLDGQADGVGPGRVDCSQEQAAGGEEFIHPDGLFFGQALCLLDVHQSRVHGPGVPEQVVRGVEVLEHRSAVGVAGGGSCGDPAADDSSPVSALGAGGVAVVADEPAASGEHGVEPLDDRHGGGSQAGPPVGGAAVFDSRLVGARRRGVSRAPCVVESAGGLFGEVRLI
jgi:hypothetical protein